VLKSNYRKFFIFFIISIFGIIFLTASDKNEPVESKAKENQKYDKNSIKKSIDHGIAYLREQQKDGKWLNHPGVTSLCLMAMINSHRNYNRHDGPWMRNPLNYLVNSQHKDGAIYDETSRAPTKNYCTSLALISLAATKDPIYKDVINKGKNFLVKIQADAGEGYDKEKDIHFGGIGYGGDQRPDLSNLHIALEAVTAAGLNKDHELFKKALVFVERCQDSEKNTLFDTGTASGGFAYSADIPTNKNLPTDKSEANNNKNEKNLIVPYGSMTFAGMRSLIFCSVAFDDEKFKESLKWVENNFSVKEHPGMKKPQTSIYYYYFTLAKTLDLIEKNNPEVLKGKNLNWKSVLAEEILSRQKKDGSWVNSEKKYMEGVPVLCSAYAINALNLIYQNL